MHALQTLQEQYASGCAVCTQYPLRSIFSLKTETLIKYLKKKEAVNKKDLHNETKC